MFRKKRSYLNESFSVDWQRRSRDENSEFFEQQVRRHAERVHVDVRVQLADQVQERIVETSEKVIKIMLKTNNIHYCIW